MNGVCDPYGRNRNMSITCKHCGVEHNVMVNPEHILLWQAGHGFIQDIMHYMDSGERELILSNICSDCWNEMFDSNTYYEDEE